MKVSLISTVKDGAEGADAFLASLAAQTRAPDEVVIVDGGSTDGTAERFAQAEEVTMIVEPGANIARGRNVALAAATHDAIAVTDADCVLEPTWLEEIVKPLEAGADVSMGFYEADAEGFFETCMAAVNLPIDPDQVDPATFNPSARSVAYTRAAIDLVGGYPEWLAIGEDMWVDLRWRERGLDMRFAPDAVVRWRLRGDLLSTWRQYFRYARGDAQAGMHADRHALRFGTYAGLVAALRSRRTWPKVLTVGGAITYARTPVQRAWDRFDEPSERVLAVGAVPALMAFTDVAKMAGYVTGLLDRR